jgi:hypothetical protein
MFIHKYAVQAAKPRIPIYMNAWDFANHSFLPPPRTLNIAVEAKCTNDLFNPVKHEGWRKKYRKSTLASEPECTQ